tara:strand:- start:551 stop:1168 length:618 start_codon:yes stop_codon:yes gene_type:complete
MTDDFDTVPLISMRDKFEEPEYKGPIVSMIAACSKNMAVGKGNDIPWYIMEDFQYFKKKTLNKPVIMGRKTFQSIGRLLPKRTNIVVTRSPDAFDYMTIPEAKRNQLIIVSSIEEGLKVAFEEAKKKKLKEIFIIGGGQIYEQGMAYAENIYLTEIDLFVHDADAFFPKLGKDWQMLSEDKHENAEYKWSHKMYKRKSKAKAVSL